VRLKLFLAAPRIFQIVFSVFFLPPSSAPLPASLKTKRKKRKAKQNHDPKARHTPSSSSSCSFFFPTFVAVLYASSSSPHIQSHRLALHFPILLSLLSHPLDFTQPFPPPNKLKIKTNA